MPTLLIMRHGKSDWSVSSAADHDRPLAARGERAARAMGAWLSETDSAPDMILSSTAQRAATTARLAAEAGGWTCEIVLDRRLYGAGPHTVVTLAREIEASRRRVLIVGHNPTWADLVPYLTREAPRHFPTAAVACVEIEGSWRDLEPGGGALRWFVTPRELDGRSQPPRRPA